MKNIKLFLTICILLVIGTSCDDYVDIKPKGIVIPAKLEDIRLLLNQSRLGETKVYAIYMDDDAAIPTSSLLQMKAGFNPSEARVYSFQDFTEEQGQNDASFDFEWKNIGIANYALEQLKTISHDDEDLYNTLRAEALVHRAFRYFLLVNHYGVQYSPDNAHKPGVPIVTQFLNTTVDLTRASVQEVYDFILNDLEEAADLMGTQNKNWSWNPTKATVYGCLAKVFLQMNDLSNAELYASKALELKSDLLDYRIEENISYSVFDYLTGEMVTKPTLPRWYENPELIFPAVNLFPLEVDMMTYSIVSPAFMSNELVGLFEDKDNDIRYSAFVDPLTNRYRGFDPMRHQPSLGVSIPELYLIRAECQARKETAEGMEAAKADLTTLLTFRYKDGTVPDFVDVTTPEKMVETVVNERRKEFMFNGHRYFDIKRYNTLYNANISVSHVDLDGNTVTLAPNDPKWVLAFPRVVTDMNPEIEPNPRK
jgi:hypothetical protein